MLMSSYVSVDFGPLTPGFEYCNFNDPHDLETLVEQIQSRKEQGHGVAAIMIESIQGYMTIIIFSRCILILLL